MDSSARRFKFLPSPFEGLRFFSPQFSGMSLIVNGFESVGNNSAPQCAGVRRGGEFQW